MIDVHGAHPKAAEGRVQSRSGGQQTRRVAPPLKATTIRGAGRVWASRTACREAAEKLRVAEHTESAQARLPRIEQIA